MRFGVDEAGKGPVLGSMFAAAVVADPGELPEDVGDSKGLAPERRAALETEIRETADRVAVAEIPVDRIDDPDTDMNSLTVAAHAEALAAVIGDGHAGSDDAGEEVPGEELAGEEKVEEELAGEEKAEEELAGEKFTGVVDAGDPDADRFGRRVAAAVDTSVADAVDTPVVDAQHGADASHSLVGAASIVAKEAREAHVADLADEYGTVGSGYPSDPQTREFLRRYVDREGTLPDCARASWQTAADVLATVEQTGLGRYEGPE